MYTPCLIGFSLFLLWPARYWLSKLIILGSAAIITTTSLQVHAEQYQQLDVDQLGFSPQIDGELSEWQVLPPNLIKITPAVDNDPKNRTGTIEVKLWLGMRDGMIYVAAQWPDDAPDDNYRPWEWRGQKYQRSKIRDDMFALRFALAGEFNRSMVADANYQVDVWVWSAGRSNRIGNASDYKHTISLKMIEDVAEYETESGKTVYIDRDRDEGYIGFSTLKPGKTRTTTSRQSIDFSREASGSVADVTARGAWNGDYWSLEMVRLLDTGHDDDVKLSAGQKILGQIAVFNKSGGQHKSVSEPLLFSFSN
ncbi:MAG: ethylbenzene dehydrogenase-related protein [Gammaproteobacteria bacterium]|nr:ethylbenzene dehydrogenase-related protein [Gammaproteobacteria bacterium]MDH3447789.1 ethylbenzene dehydrogenase-related protein [Gammaproteobacteria bacterium]